MFTLNAGSTLKTAMLRAAQGAALAFGGVFFTTFGASHGDWKTAVAAGGSAAMVALGYRGIVEGAADASRDAKRNVLPGDVGQQNK